MTHRTRILLVAIVAIVTYANTTTAEELESFNGFKVFMKQYLQADADTYEEYQTVISKSCRTLMTRIEEAKTLNTIEKELNTVRRVASKADLIADGDSHTCHYTETFKHMKNKVLAYYREKEGLYGKTAEKIYGTSVSRKKLREVVERRTEVEKRMIKSLHEDVNGRSVKPFAFTMIFKSDISEENDVVVTYE